MHEIMHFGNMFLNRFFSFILSLHMFFSVSQAIFPMRSASGGLATAAPTLHSGTFGISAQGASNHHQIPAATASTSSNIPASIPTPPEIILDPRPLPGRPGGRRYLRGKVLGKGGFAKCYEATDLDTREAWAVKIVAKASLVKQRAKVKLLSEIAIHKTLMHERVARYINHFDDADFVYIILELCPNHTLNDLLKKKRRFSEPEAMYYIYELVEGLMYLRRERVIHRDLKLGNLFLGADMDLKIGDFGLAAKLDYDEEKKTTICGTPNYIAPEILDNHNKGHSFQVDVWSLGVVMFTMLVGKPPFEDVDVKSTYQRIRDNAYSFPDSLYVSSAAKNLIQSILRHDPKSRPTVFDILNHPWFAHNMPPPLPPTIASLNRLTSSANQTPRTSAATLRAETPLKHIDFARIDSPLTQKKSSTVTRQPLRQVQNANDENYRRGPAMMASPVLRPPMAPSTAVLRQSIQSLPQARNIQAQSPMVASADEMFSRTGSRVGMLPSSLPEAWVVRWIDYSSKYGIGYQLSNGRIGVYFNDATKMVFGSNTRTVEYLFRQKGDRVDTVNVYSLDDEAINGDAKKKTTLIKNFKGYLQTNNEKEGCTRGTSAFGSFSSEETTPIVTALPLHVKRWMRTKHALVFQLSNKVWQVVFQDKTEVILSAQTHLCHYLAPSEGTSNGIAVYPLGSIGDVADEYIAKRLAYSKQVVIHMLGGGSANPNGADNIS